MYAFVLLKSPRDLQKANRKSPPVTVQTRSPQIRRARPDGHQRQPAVAAAPVLPEEEVPPARPPAEADAGYPTAPIEARGRLEDGEAAEEDDAFPDAEICGEGGGLVSVIAREGRGGEGAGDYVTLSSHQRENSLDEGTVLGGKCNRQAYIAVQQSKYVCSNHKDTINQTGLDRIVRSPA